MLMIIAKKWQLIKINVKFALMDIFLVLKIFVLKILLVFQGVNFISHQVNVNNAIKACIFLIISAVVYRKMKKFKIVYIMKAQIFVLFVLKDLSCRINSVFKDLLKIVKLIKI